MSLISRFISEQGKILSRRVNRLSLKQQRLITIAIKPTRFFSNCLSLLRKGNKDKIRACFIYLMIFLFEVAQKGEQG